MGAMILPMCILPPIGFVVVDVAKEFCLTVMSNAHPHRNGSVVGRKVRVNNLRAVCLHLFGGSAHDYVVDR